MACASGRVGLLHRGIALRQENDLPNRPLTRSDLGAMRRSYKIPRENILMYSTPKIIASLDAKVVLVNALGSVGNCSTVTVW